MIHIGKFTEILKIRNGYNDPLRKTRKIVKSPSIGSHTVDIQMIESKRGISLTSLQLRRSV